MDQDISNDYVIISEVGHIARLTLNRPKALNALNLDMIRDITFALNKWENDDKIWAVFIDGAGDRAFCAGGDIKHFYNVGMDYRRGKIGFDVPMLFFNEEYDLNQKIFEYKKPIISFMSGITMGGGYGIGGHARFRVVAPDTKFAMPETKIGFFPDIGAMYHLTRMQDNLGLYVALTGVTLSAHDMVYCGAADYLVNNHDVESFFSALCAELNEMSPNDDKNELIRKYIKNNSVSEIKADRLEDIAEVTSKLDENSSTADIVDLLKNIPEHSNVSDLCSALSMVITHKYYKLAKNKDFPEIIRQDKIVAGNFIQRSEFYEGIRAAVIEKDRAPKWEYKDVSDIPEDLAESYFR